MSADDGPAVMSQGSEKSLASSPSERTPSPIRETRDDENVDQLAPSSPIQPDSASSQSIHGPAAPIGAMQTPAGMQLPPGFPPMMMMAAPDPSDPNAPPHPMLVPGGYTPMFYPYPGVFPSSKSKRRQVKNACTNCQKACKKCDDQRPCPRCVKYGIADDCADSVRKERKKGIKRGSYKKKQEGEGEAQMQAFAIPPGYPWFPGFAQAGKDGQPQAYPYPYFITPLPAPPPSAASENGGASSNTNGTPAAAAATPTAATAFPYQMYYGGGYPYMPGWPTDPTQAAAAMAAMQHLAAGAPSQTKEKDVKMEDEDEKESEDEDGEGEVDENPVRRKPPTPPPPKPKEPVKKTKGKETAKRRSRAK